MRKSISIMFVISLFVVLGCSNDAENTDVIEMETQQNLQAIIDKNIGADKLLGVSVSIRVDGEEKWLLQGGNSEENMAVTPDMKFGIASITKTFVAATVLKLEEEGLLNINDPIGDYITLNSPNIDDSITIKQLLGHFAGLYGYFRNPDIWPRVESNLNEHISPMDLIQYVGESRFEPGSSYEYSNSNYLVLGLIIETVTNKTVGEVFREKVWTPLGMNDIYFPANEELPGPIATPWRDTDGNGTLENIAADFGPGYHSAFYTAADVFSTASTLSQWAAYLFNSDFLSEESKNKMLIFHRINDEIFTGYGLGVRRVLFDSKVYWGHTGGMRGYGSYMFHDPVTKVSISMLNNQSRSENGPVLRHYMVEELLRETLKSLE